MKIINLEAVKKIGDEYGWTDRHTNYKPKNGQTLIGDSRVSFTT